MGFAFFLFSACLICCFFAIFWWWWWSFESFSGAFLGGGMV